MEWLISCLEQVPQSLLKTLSRIFKSLYGLVKPRYNKLFICTYKVDGPKAAMSDLMKITEDFLRVIFEEEVSQLGVLRHPFPCG